MKDDQYWLGQHPEAKPVFELAQAWAAIALGKAEATTTETLKFVAVWIAFNALYNLRAPGERNERERVRGFAARSDVQALHERSLSESKEYRGAVATLVEHGVYNHDKKRLELGHSDSAKDMLTLCYTIRCNLVHGDKSPEMHRDRELVGAAYAVVRPLVEVFSLPSEFFSTQAEEP